MGEVSAVKDSKRERIPTTRRKEGMARLWELAMRKKVLVTASCALSVLSAALSFVPFIAVYYLIRELVFHATDLGADKIAVIDKGRLVEEGTHDTLVKAGGRYSRMWERYTGALNWSLARQNGKKI
jgi:ABC-type multidrug transport system fused ATPase/permease subunit